MNENGSCKFMVSNIYIYSGTSGSGIGYNQWGTDIRTA